MSFFPSKRDSPSHPPEPTAGRFGASVNEFVVALTARVSWAVDELHQLLRRMGVRRANTRTNILSTSASVFVHLGLVILTILIVLRTDSKESGPIIPPIDATVSDGDLTGTDSEWEVGDEVTLTDSNSPKPSEEKSLGSILGPTSDTSGAPLTPGELAGVSTGGGAGGTGGGTGLDGIGEGVSAAGGVDFFGASVGGRRVVFIIDNSMSMADSRKMDEAKAELIRSISKLTPIQRFQILFYNDRPFPLKFDDKPPVVANEKNRERATSQVSAVSPAGGTNHADAIDAALAMKPDVIVWLTDALDMSMTLVESVTNRNRPPHRASIHVFQLGENDVPEEQSQNQPMAQLAQRNNGTFRYVNVFKLSQP